MYVPVTMATVFKSVALGVSLVFFGCLATRGHQSDKNFGCSVVCATRDATLRCYFRNANFIHTRIINNFLLFIE